MSLNQLINVHFTLEQVNTLIFKNISMVINYNKL